MIDTTTDQGSLFDTTRDAAHARLAGAPSAAEARQAVRDLHAVLEHHRRETNRAWVERARAAMIVLWRERHAASVRDHHGTVQATVSAADLWRFLERTGFDGDKRTMSPVFAMGPKGTIWRQVGETTHPARHACKVPTWTLKEESR